MSSQFNITGFGGGAQDNEYSSQGARSWGVAIATGAGVFLVQAIIFQLLKGTRRFKRVYQPRTYLIPERQAFTSSPNNPFLWLQRIWHLDKDEIISKCGIDAWAFLRFLRTMLKCFVPLAILVPLVLFPINLIHGKYQRSIPGTNPVEFYNQTGLSILSFGNVDDQNPDLYWGHCIMAIVVIAWCCYVFFDEMIEFIKTRQTYLTSPEHRLKASASTVLVQNIPSEFRTEKALMDLFDVFPGGIRKIWLNRDFTSLANKVNRRKDIVSHLEDAITNLARKANQKQRNKQKKQAKNQEKALEAVRRGGHESSNTTSLHQSQQPETGFQQGAITNASTDREGTIKRSTSNSSRTAHQSSAPHTPGEQGEEHEEQFVSALSSSEPLRINDQYANDEHRSAVWQNYLKKRDRDTMRILRFGWTFFTTWPAWTLVGLPISKSVDRIYYCQQELAKLNWEIDREQEDADRLSAVNSAFIQFHNQAAAHMCTQMLIHHSPALMTPRTVEISPVDVLWANMATRWWVKWIIQVVVLGVFVAMLFLWAIPFLVIGFMSSLSTLGRSVSWLAWITTVPKPALDVFQGLVPPLLTQLVITLGLPALLRLLCHLTGVPSRSQGEKMLQHYYFAILFIELFLVTTISSGLTSIIQQVIEQPYNITSILASNLPSASNYYLNYIVLQAFSWSAGQLLQTARLFVLGWFKTFTNPKPRTLFNRKTFLQHQKWGNLFPFFTNMACIAMVYSVISPLILIEILLTFGLFWLVYRNNNMFVYRNTIDSTGLLFPTAIWQLFVGLYFMILALIGLFFLVREPGNRSPTGDVVVCKAQAIVMIVVGILLLAYHFSLYRLVSPLLRTMPITLEDDAVIRDELYRKQLLKRLGIDVDGGDEATSSREADSTEDRPETDHTQAANERWYHKHSKHATTALEGADDQVVRRLRLRQTRHADKASSEVQRNDNRPSGEVDGILEKLRQRQERKSVEQRRFDTVEAEHGNVKGEDAIPGILAAYNDELGNLLPAEREALIDVAYTHPALRERRPIVWLPDDDLGICRDEIERMKSYSSEIWASTRGAYFKEKTLASGITTAPPDFSEYWLVEPEL